MSRRAYWCEQCKPPTRKFLGPKEPIPVCPKHGKWKRQDNQRYFGKKT